MKPNSQAHLVELVDFQSGEYSESIPFLVFVRAL